MKPLVVFSDMAVILLLIPKHPKGLQFNDSGSWSKPYRPPIPTIPALPNFFISPRHTLKMQQHYIACPRFWDVNYSSFYIIWDTAWVSMMLFRCPVRRLIALFCHTEVTSETRIRTSNYCISGGKYSS